MNKKMEISDTEQEYINAQYKLQKKIDLVNRIDIATVKTIAGVDLAYWKKEEEEYAVCCIVVLDYHTLTVIEKKYSIGKIDVPYIPGCLAFREIPIFLNTYQKIENEPDVIFFDGNGYLHPRHMGLATHAGILLNKSTVGIAKSYYKVGDEEFVMPIDEANAYTNIEIGREVYGRVLRTHRGVKPVFLSIGAKLPILTTKIKKVSKIKKNNISAKILKHILVFLSLDIFFTFLKLF